jgi:hypothetical protein
VPQYFIKLTEFKGIDFGAGYKAVLGWRTVPAEATSIQVDKFRGCYRRRRLKALN